MKKLILIGILIIFICCFQMILPYNKLIIESIIFSLIPSLLPCLIIVNLIIEMNCLSYLYRLIGKYKFGRIIYVVILIFICFCLGMPSMQLLLIDQYDKKVISKSIVNKMIYSLGTISFPFLYGVTILNIIDRRIAIMILTIFFIVNVTILSLIDFKLNPNINVEEENKSIIYSLNKVFLNSIKTIAMISCSIIFFSLFLFLLEKIPFPWQLVAEGLIEFSYPMIKLSKQQSLISYLLIVFMSQFPSLSIIIQSKIINHKLNVYSYIIIRLIAAITSVILFLFLIKIFNYNIRY